MVKRLTKEQKVMEMAAALIKQYGGDAKAVTEAEKPIHNWRNDDAVVELAKTPQKFVMRRCRNCGKPFGHNKPIPVGELVGLCGDPCRREDWFKTTGLPYEILTTRDVWDGDPPMIIRPDQIEKLRALVEWFTKNETLLLDRATETVAPEPEKIRPSDLPVEIDQARIDKIQAELFADEVDESAFQDQDEPPSIPEFSLDHEEPSQMAEEVEVFEF